LAQEAGVAFGVGSMRILLDRPELLPTFAVQSRPPLLLANLGAQQLVQRGTDAALRLIGLIKADGIAIHLNAAQELVQEGGDRDFRGQIEAIGQLVPHANVIVKETGCGLSPAVVSALWDAGVKAVDVSGLGGTSWPRVEQLRAKTTESRGLGELLSDWGIPTAACIAAARESNPEMHIIGSGGVRSGLDAAKAIALGADVAGFALPIVRAHQQGGVAAARETLKACIASLKAAFLLCGARNAVALRATRPIVLEPLKTWIEGLAE
jgi:isopentenyl-diphosphate delta-isomerase